MRQTLQTLDVQYPGTNNHVVIVPVQNRAALKKATLRALEM